MTGGDLLVAALAALGAGLGLVAVVGLSLTVRQLRHDRRVRAERTVRPILFEALDTGDIDSATFDALDPVEQRALEALARSLLPKLRGQDRDALTRVLDRRGTVSVAHRHTRSRRASVRARAGQFLGDAGAESSLRDLIVLLHDPNPQVRWAAARGLGRLGNPTAISPLLACLEGAHPLPVDLVADAVFEIRQCPVALLRQSTRSTCVPVRAVAVELLGRMQAFAAAEDVVRILGHDPSPEVRARAARSLGRMGSPRALEPLLAALDSSPAPVRVQALWALGEIGAPEAIPALRTALLGPSRQLGEVAAVALTGLGPLGARVLAHVAEGQGQAAETAAAVLAKGADVQLSAS